MKDIKILQSGTVLILLEIGSLFGSILPGKMVDRCNSYKKQVQIFLLFTVLVLISMCDFYITFVVKFGGNRSCRLGEGHLNLRLFELFQN